MWASSSDHCTTMRPRAACDAATKLAWACAAGVALAGSSDGMCS
jgi:hypothetical protein